MATRITRKELLKKDDAFTEAGHDAQEWIEENWRRVAAVGGAILALMLLIALWSWWSGRQAADAGRLLAQGLELYRPAAQSPAPGQPARPGAPRYAEALPLFEKAAGIGSAGGAATVATFYQGATLLQLGRAQEAVPLLDKVISGTQDDALRDSASLVLAQALDAAGQTDRAATVLDELSRKVGAVVPPDVALLRLGSIRLKQGKTDDARRAWQDVLARYPDSASAADARDFLARSGGAPVGQ